MFPCFKREAMRIILHVEKRILAGFLFCERFDVVREVDKSVYVLVAQI